jgi:hypothetical protein
MVATKSLRRIGLCLALSLLVTIPAFAQSGENADWQAIEDQRDARRKAELLDAFIKKYTSSGHRPDADFMLVDFYLQNRDNAKIMQHAEGFRTNLPTADNASKTRIFSQAMVAAATLNNIQKVVEYAGYALQADPNNLTVLALLAGSNLPDPNKAVEHAQKALTVARPSTMTQEQYDRTQARMHGIVALPLFAQQKFAEAQEHLGVALKANPKDQLSQYRYGFASVNLAGVSAKDAQDAYTALLKASTATPTNKAEVDAAKAKMDTASQLALKHRDDAIDALAKAVAIGAAPGASAPITQQSKELLDSLYKNKAGSLEGEDQLIADKKKELGL